MKEFYSACRRFCAVLVGFIFFGSGLLKLMDPVGTSLIISDYFKFFHIGFLKFSSYFLGELFALCESALGVALITGVFRKIVALTTGAFLAFFTVITLILLIANPVMDCGCFGEAIHLTHAQSFVKNLILLALWAVSAFPLASIGEGKMLKRISAALAYLAVLAFALMSAIGIPAVDFMSYAPGKELSESFQYSDEDGFYHSALQDGQVMYFSVYNPGRISSKKWMRIENQMSDAQMQGFEPVLLVAGSPDQVPSYIQEPYFADRKMLLTLNRSNGGVTYANDGQVIRKWSSRAFPSEEKLEAIYEQEPEEVASSRAHKGKMYVQGLLLYSFAVMLLL